jgi:putative acetyltransferase
MNRAMEIRDEVLGDHAAIRRLHLGAFPGAQEADLVERLRADGDAVISLVAIEGTEIVGHVMFSRMRSRRN